MTCLHPPEKTPWDVKYHHLKWQSLSSHALFFYVFMRHLSPPETKLVILLCSLPPAPPSLVLRMVPAVWQAIDTHNWEGRNKYRGQRALACSEECSKDSDDTETGFREDSNLSSMGKYHCYLHNFPPQDLAAHKNIVWEIIIVLVVRIQRNPLGLE